MYGDVNRYFGDVERYVNRYSITSLSAGYVVSDEGAIGKNINSCDTHMSGSGCLVNVFGPSKKTSVCIFSVPFRIAQPIMLIYSCSYVGSVC